MTASEPNGPTAVLTKPEAAPAVVAVVVTCNAGSWFRETLQAMRDQDYPNLSVLIIDAASAEDPLERIVEVLPTAYVRRLSRNPGYAAASNRVLRILQGAAYLVMCHDDIAPAPDAIRKMVEEAMRTNAGVVTPKMVDWMAPDRLTALGGTADITAAFVPAVEPGDLDQGQHDAPGEVFVAPSGCTLVRADLFTSLGGFDSAMTFEGEDVDFSWRAHVVGARVVTAASARVRHLEASNKGWRSLDSGETDDDDSPTSHNFDRLVLLRRNRLRTVLKVQRRFQLLRTLVALIGLSIGEVIYGIVSGRTEHIGAVTAAWTWNIAHGRDVRKLRKQLQKFRTTDDVELRARLIPTRARVEDLVTREWERWREQRQAERVKRHGRDFAGRVRHLPFAVWATVLVIWIAGSRHVINGTMPIVGQMTPFIGGPISSLKQFSGFLPTQAWGLSTLQSPIYLISAVLSMISFGAIGELYRFLVFATLPVGVWGMVRLTRRLQSPRARLMAVVAYAAVPVPYDSLSLGRWDGMVCYAIAPFILHRLLFSLSTAPWIDRTRIEFLRRRSPLLDDDDLEKLVLSETLLDANEVAATPSSQMRAASALLAEREVAVAAAAIESVITDHVSMRLRFIYSVFRRVFPLALLTALGALVAPQILVAVLVMSAALGVGAVLTNLAWRECFRLTAVAAGAAVVTLLLIFPAVVGSDAGWHGFWQMPMSTATPTGFGAILRLYVGGTAPALASFGLIIAALPGVLVGNAWRLTISLRLWMATLVLVIVTWAGAHSWLGGWHPDPHVFLAFAGATLALNAAIGVVALQQDLRTHSFGWRQALPIVAVLSVAISIIPVASRAGSGSWNLPSLSNAQLLSWMNGQQRSTGSFRVLWLGDGDAMPAGARRLSGDLAGAVSVDAPIPKGPALPASGGDGQKALADAIQTARNGDTVQLGRLLAPYSVRYIVVPNSTGAVGGSGKSVPPPSDLIPALSSQLDLGLVNTDRSMTVYQNTAFAPLRAALTPAEVQASRNPTSIESQSVDLSQALPVLPRGTGRTWTGGLSQEDVFVGEDSSSAWHLKVGGHGTKRTTGFGWGNLFSVGRSGNGELHFVPSFWIPFVQILNAVGWVVTIYIVIHFRPRTGRWV